MRFITVDTPITFERELTHVKNYIKLEKLRFGDLLNIEYDISVASFCLPALSVQPLIENAIKHGIGQRETGGTVKLITKRTDKYILIQVIDDGVGMERKASYNEKSQKEHIGIENVASRLGAMCGGALSIESAENTGTAATISLPLEGGKDNEGLSS